MIVRTLLAAALLVGPGPALAQANADKARLDEFAAPASRASGEDEVITIDQLAAPRDRRLATPPQAGDAPARREPVTQLARPGERGATEQVGRDQQRNASAAPALSSRAAGRPEGVVTLGGSDRCDPQEQDAARLAVCRRVIERRAGEFAAPAPARISAEAALLSISRDAASLADAATMDRRIRSAGGPVDAEDRANQELATVVLAGEPAVPAEPLPAEEAKSLSEVLSEIIFQPRATTP